MIIKKLIEKHGMTMYRLAVTAGIPHATLNDITREYSNSPHRQSSKTERNVWIDFSTIERLDLHL